MWCLPKALSQVAPNNSGEERYSREEQVAAALYVQRRWRSMNYKQRSIRSALPPHQSEVRRRKKHGKAKAQYSELQAGELSAYSSAMHYYLRFPLSSIHDPVHYNNKLMEVFVLLVIVCWVMTWTMRPDTLANNPLSDAWGYNNVCVGFDEVPMRYVAAVLWTVVSAFALQYTETVCGSLLLEEKQGVKNKRSKCDLYLMLTAHIGFCATTCADRRRTHPNDRATRSRPRRSLHARILTPPVLGVIAHALAVGSS